MVEIGTHSAIERADVVTLDLRVRATQFYPNRAAVLLDHYTAVVAETKLGKERFGVRGTPIIMLSDGTDCATQFPSAFCDMLLQLG
jgi:hypothetical protein